MSFYYLLKINTIKEFSMNKLVSKLVEDFISFNPSVLVDKDKPKHKLP